MAPAASPAAPGPGTDATAGSGTGARAGRRSGRRSARVQDGPGRPRAHDDLNDPDKVTELFARHRTVADVARALGVSESAARRARNNHQLPAPARPGPPTPAELDQPDWLLTINRASRAAGPDRGRLLPLREQAARASKTLGTPVAPSTLWNAMRRAGADTPDAPGGPHMPLTTARRGPGGA